MGDSSEGKAALRVPVSILRSSLIDVLTCLLQIPSSGAQYKRTTNVANREAPPPPPHAPPPSWRRLLGYLMLGFVSCVAVSRMNPFLFPHGRAVAVLCLVPAAGRRRSDVSIYDFGVFSHLPLSRLSVVDHQSKARPPPGSAEDCTANDHCIVPHNCLLQLIVL